MLPDILTLQEIERLIKRRPPGGTRDQPAGHSEGDGA